MVLVQYAIQGDPLAPETGFASSFDLAELSENRGNPPTLAMLKEAFPFCGEFHFRIKQAISPADYIWMDLIDPKQVLQP
ncbi:unnamed protein product, partial [Heterosigma akashiwo]